MPKPDLSTKPDPDTDLDGEALSDEAAYRDKEREREAERRQRAQEEKASTSEEEPVLYRDRAPISLRPRAATLRKRAPAKPFHVAAGQEYVDPQEITNRNQELRRERSDPMRDHYQTRPN